MFFLLFSLCIFEKLLFDLRMVKKRGRFPLRLRVLMVLVSSNSINNWMESPFYYSIKNRRKCLLRVFKTFNASLLQACFGYGRLGG